MPSPRTLKNLDWVLLLTAVAMAALGIAFIWSATHWVPARAGMAGQQLRWLGLSLLVLIAMLSFDYEYLATLAWPAYIAALASLALVFLIGETRNNAQRWIALPGFMVQPSEIAKVLVVLALARYLRYRRDLRTFRGLIVPMFIVMVPFAMILKQPDLGTALVLIPALVAMLFVAGASVKHLAAIAMAGVAAAPLLWFFVMGPAQKGRITSFLAPERDPFGAAWHLRQSIAAIASGGGTGMGYSSGSPVLLNRGFAAHTDFIFAVVSHEWGFIGAMLVLMLLFLFFTRGIEIAVRTREPFGRLAATGLLAILAWQAVVNIGMTVRLCPITGVTLPFMSYGGSSMLVCFVMLAMVLNIGMRRKPVVAPGNLG